MITRFFQSISEKIQGQAGVGKVFGEPIEAQGKTLIPVAKVTFGYGAGVGNLAQHEEGSDHEGRQQTGAGGGAGAVITPLGVMEITKNSTRFVPAEDWKKWTQIFLTGFTTALLVRKLLIGKNKK